LDLHTPDPLVAQTALAAAGSSNEQACFATRCTWKDPHST
jgi:hypothetical protein